MRIFVDNESQTVTVQWESRGAFTVLHDDNTVSGRFSPPWGAPVYDSDAPSQAAREHGIWLEAHEKGAEAGAKHALAEAKRALEVDKKDSGTVHEAMREAGRSHGLAEKAS
ncbi:MAG TPA: hypothetical protein VGH54_16815 [Mycobacterium sp.]|uniref:hypothetical protein n=1 Tax=Mycobacterium sp. TaxID=1785 RepID=UPI002F41EC61